MTQTEFLTRLRAHKGLRHAVVSEIEIDAQSRVCSFRIVTDSAYTEEDANAARALVREAVPASMHAAVSIHKLVADEQLIKNKILAYLSRNHRAASACIAAEDIDVVLGDPVRFSFGVDEAERGFFEKNEELLPGVERMLAANFCNAFEGSLVEKDKGGIEEDDEREEEEIFDFRPARTFAVENFEAIDEENVPKEAIYISDATFRSDKMTLCGAIRYIQERTSQKGKPYLRFTIADASGVLSFSYFPQKKTEEKIRALQPGDSIVCTGENEMFNDRLSFTARFINRGNAPEGFVPEKRKGKSLPLRYAAVVPEKLEDFNQLSLFGNSELPPDLVNNTFVVFDLETTGLVNSPTGGNMDAITEIGAVKIEHGEIREKFTTLVDPERKLTEEIVKLTGITDDMLVGAPKIGQVIPDFLKFCDGCILVGHNVQFDYKFVRYYAEQEEYEFDYKTFDTLSIAQGMLFLPNYKLNTLADYYHFSFQHHRAWDDAYVTAKIFIELIKAKKCLPKS